MHATTRFSGVPGGRAPAHRGERMIFASARAARGTASPRGPLGGADGGAAPAAGWASETLSSGKSRPVARGRAIVRFFGESEHVYVARVEGQNSSSAVRRRGARCCRYV
jgi:hypothetical protein